MGLRSNPPYSPPYTAAQLTVLSAFGSQEYLRDQFYIVDWSLFDRCKIEPGSWTPETFHFYTGREGKTDADTNVRKANQLPMPNAFSINKSIFFLFSAAMAESDRHCLMDSYAWEFRMGRKCYCTGPLARFPNVIRFDEIQAKPFTFPSSDPAVEARNQRWLDSLPEDRRTAPALREVAAEVREIQLPLIIEQEIYFSMQAVGKPSEPIPPERASTS